MVSRVRIVFLSALIGLLSPLPGRAQSTLTLVDNEELQGAGPGDNMVFAVRRNVRYVTSLAFNSGEAVTHRLERDGTIGEEVGRTYIGVEPRAIALARDGDYAVVVNSIANELVAMSVGDDGVLREVSRTPSGGLNPYDVAVAFEEVVVVANRDSDQINTFHIDRRGQLRPLTQASTGMRPHVVSVSRRDGMVAVANETERSVSLFEVNRRGEMDSLGPAIAMSVNGSNPPASMTPRTLAWSRRNLFVALDGPGALEDVIRAFHVSRRGVVEQRGDTPAGAFLTDIDVQPNTLIAVTVNRNNLANPTDDRDEVRVYRRNGTALTLDASVQTPGVPPSFKQVTTWPGIGRVWHVLVTEFQGGWLRSLLYEPDEP